MNRPRDPGIATNVLGRESAVAEVAVAGLRQSIQASREIKQNGVSGTLRPRSLIDIEYSELSIRTDSIQFGRPFRRIAADVGATGDWLRASGYPEESP